MFVCKRYPPGQPLTVEKPRFPAKCCQPPKFKNLEEIAATVYYIFCTRFFIFVVGMEDKSFIVNIQNYETNTNYKTHKEH